jgi:hypothetical protein
MLQVPLFQRNYAREKIYICSDSQAALQALKATMITSKLVWECRQAICTLSSRTKLILLWVSGHSGIQGNEDSDAFAKKASTNQFLGPEPEIPISPCVKEQLVGKHSRYRVTTPRMELFIDRPSEKKKYLKDLLPSMQTGNKNVNWPLYLREHINIMSFSDNAIRRKCGGGIPLLKI